MANNAPQVAAESSQDISKTTNMLQWSVLIVFTLAIIAYLIFHYHEGWLLSIFVVCKAMPWIYQNMVREQLPQGVRKVFSVAFYMGLCALPWFIGAVLGNPAKEPGLLVVNTVLIVIAAIVLSILRYRYRSIFAKGKFDFPLVVYFVLLGLVVRVARDFVQIKLLEGTTSMIVLVVVLVVFILIDHVRNMRKKAQSE